MMTECDTDTPIERALSHEDTVSIPTGIQFSLLEMHAISATIGSGGFRSKLLMVKGWGRLGSYWVYKAN